MSSNTAEIKAKTAKLVSLWQAEKAPHRRDSLRGKIISINLELAYHLAIAYGKRCHIDLDDLKGEATVALCTALNGFDPSKAPFHVRATTEIKKALMHYRRDKGLLIRAPRCYQEGIETINKLWKIDQRDGSKLLTKPDIAYIEFGWDESEYKEALASTKRGSFSSLDAGTEGGIDIPTRATPESNAIAEEKREAGVVAIAATLAECGLGPEERKWVYHHYFDGMNHGSIAKLYGIRPATKVKDVIESLAGGVAA